MPAAAKANRGPSAGPGNRRALIAAAREVFGESGLSAPLSSVARRAGVGQGSLYRHFPDRISLAVAVFDDNIQELEKIASDPRSTIDDLFARVAEQAIESSALIDLMTSNRHDPRAQQLAVRVTAVAGTLVARDRDDGRIGAHVDVDGVMLAMSMLAFVLSRAEPGERIAVAARASSLLRRAFDPRPGSASTLRASPGQE